MTGVAQCLHCCSNRDMHERYHHRYLHHIMQQGVPHFDVQRTANRACHACMECRYLPLHVPSPLLLPPLGPDLLRSPLNCELPCTLLPLLAPL